MSIKLKNLSLHYPILYRNDKSIKILNNKFNEEKIKNNSIEALKNINLNIQNGIYGLYGKNGSGKTSLLKIIAKIFYPTIGSAKIIGKISSLINIRFGLNPILTGYENIELRLHYEKLSSEEIKNLKFEISENSGLGKYLNLPIKCYSTGMSFRLAFYIIKYLRSDILLLDEFISAADRELDLEVKNTINEKLQNSNISIIASTNLKMLKTYTNKIIYINNGTII
jgi:ABC-type polysaccharide/polyol phosphate transport system ATPase subunit